MSATAKDISKLYLASQGCRILACPSQALLPQCQIAQAQKEPASAVDKVGALAEDLWPKLKTGGPPPVWAVHSRTRRKQFVLPTAPQCPG